MNPQKADTSFSLNLISFNKFVWKQPKYIEEQNQNIFYFYALDKKIYMTYSLFQNKVLIQNYFSEK